MSLRDKLKTARTAIDDLIEELYGSEVVARPQFAPESKAAIEAATELVMLKRSGKNRRSENNTVLALKAKPGGPKVPESWVKHTARNNVKAQQLREMIFAALPRERLELYPYIEARLPKAALKATTQNGTKKWTKNLCQMVSNYIRDGKLVEGKDGKLRAKRS